MPTLKTKTASAFDTTANEVAWELLPYAEALVKAEETFPLVHAMVYLMLNSVALAKYLNLYGNTDSRAEVSAMQAATPAEAERHRQSASTQPWREHTIDLQ